MKITTPSITPATKRSREEYRGSFMDIILPRFRTLCYTVRMMTQVDLDAVLQELTALHAKIDELLEDSRKARPLLDKYLKFAGGGWKGIGRK